MAQQTRFIMGDRAPNEGEYMEVGVNDHHMGINNPKHVYLHKGEKFPENTNDDRQWKLKRHGKGVV